MTARKAAHSLQRAKGALASGFATVDLHHATGHDRCWPSDVFVDPRTVNVHIATLRRLLGPGFHGNPIRSVRSLGYGLAGTQDGGEAC